MGGNIIGVIDDDVSLVYQNPGALNPEMHNGILFHTTRYFAGINFGYAGYARNMKSIGTTFGAGLQYIAYGNFIETDPSGNEQGEFSAGEYVLNLSAARAYDRFSYGAHLKTIYSSLEQYSSVGMAIDLGGTYNDTARLFTVGAVIKNIGMQLKSYTPDNKEPLPFEIQVGITKRLKYLPFQLSVAAHNLQKPDIRYDDPRARADQNLFAGDADSTGRVKSHTLDKIARHFILGGEFLIGNNLRIRMGYNHMRRMEMSLSTLRSFAGFSFGAGFKIAHFRIDYGLVNYHIAGASHHFSVSTNFSKFL